MYGVACDSCSEVSPNLEIFSMDVCFLIEGGRLNKKTPADLDYRVIYRLNYARINAKRDREGNEKNFSLLELSEMGNDAPTFRYML